MTDDLVAELRRAHPQSADGELRHRAADEIERLRAKREHEKQSFDLRWRADRRAIKLWQEATGKELEWPNHADLVVWLLEQLVEAKHAIDVYDGTIEFARIADLRRAAEIKVLLGKLQPSPSR